MLGMLPVLTLRSWELKGPVKKPMAPSLRSIVTSIVAMLPVSVVPKSVVIVPDSKLVIVAVTRPGEPASGTVRAKMELSILP